MAQWQPRGAGRARSRRARAAAHSGGSRERCIERRYGSCVRGRGGPQLSAGPPSRVLYSPAYGYLPIGSLQRYLPAAPRRRLAASRASRRLPPRRHAHADVSYPGQVGVLFGGVRCVWTPEQCHVSVAHLMLASACVVTTIRSLKSGTRLIGKVRNLVKLSGAGFCSNEQGAQSRCQGSSVKFYILHFTDKFT